MRQLWLSKFKSIALACSFACLPSLAQSASDSSESTKANNSSAHVEVALQWKNTRPYVMANIHNGVPIEAYYDTGSQSALIAQSLAEQLKLEVIGEAMVGSPGGSAPIAAKIYSLGQLDIEGFEAVNLDAVASADANLPKGVQLIIGNNQFSNALVELDFINNQFRLRKNHTENSAQWQKLDGRGMLSSSLKISDQTVPLHIDTGNPSLLDLPDILTSKIKLQSPLRNLTATINMIDRTLPIRAARIKTQAQFAGNTAELNGEYRFAPFPFANLGCEGLKGAKLKIDNINRRWQLTYPNTKKLSLVNGPLK